MNYLERLISRALAVPREGPAAVFDPFEQTDGWLIDEPSRAAAPEASTRPAATVLRGDLPTPAATPDPIHAVARPEQRPTPPAPVTAVAPPSRNVGDQAPPPRGMEQPPAAAPAFPDRPKGAHSPIEKADAFMQALNNPPARETTRQPARPARSDTDATSATPTPPLAPPTAHVVRAAPPLAPPAPPVRHPTTPGDVPERRRSQPGASDRTTQPGDAPTSTRQVASVPPAGIARRIAPSRSARRDDLASSVGIVRFGLGQG